MRVTTTDAPARRRPVRHPRRTRSPAARQRGRLTATSRCGRFTGPALGATTRAAGSRSLFTGRTAELVPGPVDGRVDTATGGVSVKERSIMGAAPPAPDAATGPPADQAERDVGAQRGGHAHVAHPGSPEDGGRRPTHRRASPPAGWPCGRTAPLDESQGPPDEVRVIGRHAGGEGPADRPSPSVKVSVG